MHDVGEVRQYKMDSANVENVGKQTGCGHIIIQVMCRKGSTKFSLRRCFVKLHTRELTSSG